jgi:hypothetical protein
VNRFGVWLFTGATACAGASPPVAPVAGAVTSTAAPAPALPPTAPPPPIDLEADAALGREASEGEIIVRTSVLRGHPVGAESGPILAMWPGWRGTLRAIAREPLKDLDWIEIVGPPDASRGRMLAFASPAGDPAVDGRLVALQARSAEPATSHVEGHLTAAAARLDGVLRVIFRPGRPLVAVAAAASGPALSHALLRARVRAPSLGPREALRADLPHPHETLRALPSTILRMRTRILVLPDGGADATAEGDCANAEDAGHAASSLREMIARQNNPIVRMLTQGILDAIAISTNGATVGIHVPANRGQLEALLALVSATAGLRDEGAP